MFLWYSHSPLWWPVDRHPQLVSGHLLRLVFNLPVFSSYSELGWASSCEIIGSVQSEVHFLQARCPSCQPTKAPRGNIVDHHWVVIMSGVLVTVVYFYLLVSISDSSAVNASAHSAESASSVTHQQLFQLIATNNKLRKSRLAHEDWSEGWTFLGPVVVVTCCHIQQLFILTHFY